MSWQNYGTFFGWLESLSLLAALQVANAITGPMSTRTPSSEMSVAWDAWVPELVSVLIASIFSKVALVLMGWRAPAD